jgi:hypothetical protein
VSAVLALVCAPAVNQPMKTCPMVGFLYTSPE